MTVIRHDEYMDELMRLQSESNPNDPGKTAQEWAEEVGRGIFWVRSMLYRGLKSGTLVRGKTTRERLDGHYYTTSVYSFAPRAKKKKGK